MGYAGNLEPDFVIPTAISELDKKSTLSTSNKNDEFNYAIGYDALTLARDSKAHTLTYPMANGLINNWDLMEKYWNHSIYHYLKCDPESHYFVLTEPPMNPPENRENMAEIFFETFNVAGLYIGVQATLALLGCNTTVNEESINKKNTNEDTREDQIKAIKSLTGMVIDSGDGVTHCVPLCDGYVLGSNIKHIPIAGRRITKFMMDMIKDRGETVKNEDLLYATMEAKEKYGYLCKDVIEELNKYDEKDYNESTQTYSLNSKYKKLSGTGKISRKPYNIDLGHELFLGPEAFFSPEIIDKNYSLPLDEILDITVQSCPVDYRRRLYSNVVLSGGSTMFKNFDKRLELSVQKRVEERLQRSATGTIVPKPIKVNVMSSSSKQHSVWLGGSAFATGVQFKKALHLREEYLERGPSCCRFNPVFGFN
mmetsp:Transcript_24958/g.26051  ORF Transcript_24958/g.26051 Transcript_24958/m.26051 type:complete len:424 (+) Transcript_24958:70-1341(+)